MGEINSNSKCNHSKINETKEESSYNSQLNSENSIQFKKSKKQSTYGHSETTESTKKVDLNEKKIPFKFEWKEGGHEVKIAGCFLNNWKEIINMEKNINTGCFEIILDIPKGIHQFKFIVDSKWVCSSNYKTINEKNNINNIIDLTYYNPNKNTQNENASLKDKIIINKKIKNSKDYSCNIPQYNEVNTEPSETPLQYLNTFNINIQSKQKYLKKYQDYINYDRSKNIIENNIFKSIMTLPHDKVSHLLYNVDKINNDCNNKFISTSITQRNKHKFLTIIYYTPKKE